MPDPNKSGKRLLPLVRRWWEQGVVPVPILWKSKKSAIRWREWSQQFPSWPEVHRAFNTHLYRGIALLTGAISHNLVVLDFDDILSYVRWQQRTGLDSYTVKTSRGLHVYLRLDEPPNTTLSMDGGEVKGNGYVIAPPSLHKSGAQYRVYREISILSAKNLRAVSIVPIVHKNILEKRIERTDSVVKKVSRGSIIKMIKDNVLIDSLLHTELIPSGPDGWFMCCCPFHDDHTPSMWVNTVKGLCNCYNPHCIAHSERPMDVINLYSLITGLQNGDAIAELAKGM